MARVVTGRSSIKQRRRKRIALFAAMCIALLVAIFLFFWWFFNASFLTIRDIEVTGENIVPESSIDLSIRHDIKGQYMGLFSKAGIFFYPKERIEQNLLMLYPTLKSVHISAKDFHTIKVEVTERTPEALWCGEEGGQCYLLDADGLAYANAPQYAGQVYQTYSGSLPGDVLPRQFSTPEEFHSLSALVDVFSKKFAPDKVRRVTVDAHNDVRLSFSGGFDVLFALHDDGGAIFNNISLAMTTEPFLSRPLSDFEYIDARFDNKVYYKLKNQ